MKLFLNHKSYIIILFLLALCLRLYGLNWDQGQHLHPDERFLTMVVNDIKLPSSISEYLNNNTSPLNPYNYPNYQFFVYGTFPIFLTKVVTVITHLDDYGHIQLVGRTLSAVFDSFNIILLYFLARKLFIKNSKLKYLPSLLYAFCVLPLQLSHFFAVDTYLNTFLLITFTLLLYNQFLLAAIFFGLALASKISAVYFTPIIFLFLFQRFLSTKKIFPVLLITVYCSLITFFIFRFFQPYAFSGIFNINPHFIANLKELQSYSSPDASFPPAVQWQSKTPLSFSLQNIVLWGIGLPLSLLFILSLFKIKRSNLNYPIVFALIWILLLYFYQGSQFVHTMRYFLPIYPFIILISAYFCQKLNLKIFLSLVIGHLIFGFMFLSIYSRPQSRVQASFWIYENIPAGSKTSGEDWDDWIPLGLPNYSSNQYQGVSLSMYDSDTPEKWLKLNPRLESLDYLIMSSNRLWGSIPLVPEKYPETSVFYQNLFNEKLNFSHIKTVYSYPGINIPMLKRCYLFGPTNYPGSNNNWFSVDNTCTYPGFYLRDDTAEEAFTVYDHPKVLIFRKIIR